MTAYKFGDIVLIGFPHTDLQGVAKRPAIVLFDSDDQDVLVARVTTQEYMSRADYKIFDWKKGGLLAESYGVKGTSYINPVKRENEKILSFIKTPS